MRKTSIGRQGARTLLVLLIAMLVGFLALPDVALTQMKIPKDLTMSATGNQSPVVFSHEKHVEGQKLECKSCHVKLFQMKAGKTAEKGGALTMAQMGEGQFCGSCHDGKASFGVKDEANCTKCHVKP